MDWFVRRTRAARVAVLIAAMLWAATPAFAQAGAEEDVEPRIVGAEGITAIGIAGFIDTFRSSEDTFPLQLTLHADVRRFLTDRIAVRGGVLGSEAFGGGVEDPSTGPGVPALHLQIGADYYFTPASMASFYAGAEYRVPLTSRADKESGAILGIGGVEAAVSSRTRLFAQGGYGTRLTRGSDDEVQTRLTAEVGVRIKF